MEYGKCSVVVTARNDVARAQDEVQIDVSYLEGGLRKGRSVFSPLALPTTFLIRCIINYSKA